MSLLRLFDPDDDRHDDIIAGSETATQALSVTAVENDFVEGVYDKIAWVYDVFFGPMLHPGRLQAMQRMAIRPGDRILEVGTGTGINAVLYPSHCHVTAIDFSASMLEKARDRIARKGIFNVRLLEMDAGDLKFADGSFDIVYAPYLINVVHDPVLVASEMRRVCRPGGRLVFLNHFRSTHPVRARIDRLLTPFTIHVGFKADFDLDAFLHQAGLRADSVEKVGILGQWSLVTCVREEEPAQ